MRRILSIILLCALLLSGSAFAAGVQPIVEARLPEFAPYPDETTLEDVEGDAWDKWFEERKTRQEAGAGCSEGMEPFQVAAAGGHAQVLPPVPPYLDVQLDRLQARLVRRPKRAEVPVVADVQLVVEYYAAR